MLDFLRGVGKNIYQGAQKMFGIAKKGSDYIKGMWAKAKAIPIIGDLLGAGEEVVGEIPIPNTAGLLKVKHVVKGTDMAINYGDKVLNPKQ
jgi:hypothetical protein